MSMRYEIEKHRIDEGRLRAFWNDASDLLMVGQQLSETEAICIASPFAKKLLGQKVPQPRSTPV